MTADPEPTPDRDSYSALPIDADADELRRWNEDLDVVAREMPAVHANLFHTLGREQFDGAIADIRHRLPGHARHQVIVELMRLAAAIGDGHTTVSPWRDPVGFHTLPVSLYRFADGYCVRAATRAQATLLGARVTHVGGVPIDSVENLVAPLIGRDNDMGVLMYAPILLVMAEVLHGVGVSDDPRRAELTMEVDGSPRTVSLDSAGPFPDLAGGADKWWGPRDGWVDLRDGAAVPLWLSQLTETYWYSYLSDGELLYCQLNEIQERGERLDAFFARALAAADSLGARRFVLDLRHNSGGDGDLNGAIVRALLQSRFDERGRLFVITGRRTFSAAQMLISDLEKWTFPIFVGEPAASHWNHYGDSELLVLPNHRITVRVSTLWWQWDPRDARPWIAVDLAAALTVDAYRTGRDPALEAIAAF
ncbi:MAG TPA: hypothetical protein VEX15_23815 [Nocardioidaceae bacterium]|nr:hypothetical protein [Nocardioidaceae bacterium]